MLALLLALQVQAGTPRMSLVDSAALRERVEDAQFQFMMDWRYLWHSENRDLIFRLKKDPLPTPANYNAGNQTRLTRSGCAYQATPRFDVDRHSFFSHLIKSPNRLRMSLCPMWFNPRWYEPPDERKSIDAAFGVMGMPPDALDSARSLRKPMIALLDSAARRLPGDPFIAGQRVRLLVDQQRHVDAARAARECKADFWWCFALEGYARFAGGDATQASELFDKARPLMPDSLRCAWDDAGMFFTYTGRDAYSALSCRQRDSLNARVWWLADPLYIENGNERRAEHYYRHVLVELHRALEADERFDWRENYQGPALMEMVVRYGWPTHIQTMDPKPIRWRRGDTKSLFLGDPSIISSTPHWCDGMVPEWTLDAVTHALASPENQHVAVICSGPRPSVWGPPGSIPTGTSCIDETGKNGPLLDFPCNPMNIVPGTRYWGPQFSTMPLWPTVLDPFHATDEGWDLAPPRDDVGPYWDTSWWAPEFYRRDSGPLVPLMSQHAFFRRQRTAILAANMQWDTIAYLTKPLDRMVAATMITKGPNLPMAGAKDTMSGKNPRPLVSQVPSGPALLAIEMIPRDLTGPAARTRFGVDVPQPLSALKPGELALSDIVLARANDNEALIESMTALMPRMLGSIMLRNPRRIALFWELYGAGTGDTLDVSLRIIRKNEANSVQQFGAILGIGSAADDSVVQTWREPRPGDPMATVEGGISIRPRSIIIDMGALPKGRYSVELQVKRGVAPPAVTKREFRIDRR